MRSDWLMDVLKETYSSEALREAREKADREHPCPLLEADHMPKDQLSFISVENGRLVEKARIVNLGEPPG